MANWYIGTLVEKGMVSEDVMSLSFHIPDFPTFISGQHCDIRLTSANGYSTERSYSIANAPEDGKNIVEFGVQLLENGEVSPYLHSLTIGKKIEIRGPIGNHFVWNISMAGPLILIGGGSGMVPLMSMLRHHEKNIVEDANRDILFFVSARNENRILYRKELESFVETDKKLHVVSTLTDTQPIKWDGFSRRIDRKMVEEVFGIWKEKMPMIYICGPTKFVETTAEHLVGIGFNPHSIKTERFG